MGGLVGLGQLGHELGAERVGALDDEFGVRLRRRRAKGGPEGNKRAVFSCGGWRFKCRGLFPKRDPDYLETPLGTVWKVALDCDGCVTEP